MLPQSCCWDSERQWQNMTMERGTRDRLKRKTETSRGLAGLWVGGRGPIIGLPGTVLWLPYRLPMPMRTVARMGVVVGWVGPCRLYWVPTLPLSFWLFLAHKIGSSLSLERTELTPNSFFTHLQDTRLLEPSDYTNIHQFYGWRNRGAGCNICPNSYCTLGVRRWATIIQEQLLLFDL